MPACKVYADHPQFVRDLKTLSKRFPSLKPTLHKTFAALERSAAPPGDPLIGFPDTYKLRLTSPPLGKRGGFRLLFRFRNREYMMLALLCKRDRENFTKDDIRRYLQTADKLAHDE